MDKIANYRPQQNSLGSKLVSVWAESPGMEGGGLLSIILQSDNLRDSRGSRVI